MYAFRVKNPYPITGPFQGHASTSEFIINMPPASYWSRGFHPRSVNFSFGVRGYRDRLIRIINIIGTIHLSTIILGGVGEDLQPVLHRLLPERTYGFSDH